jgi:hypothetical protein
MGSKNLSHCLLSVRGVCLEHFQSEACGAGGIATASSMPGMLACNDLGYGTRRRHRQSVHTSRYFVSATPETSVLSLARHTTNSRARWPASALVLLPQSLEQTCKYPSKRVVSPRRVPKRECLRLPPKEEDDAAHGRRQNDASDSKERVGLPTPGHAKSAARTSQEPLCR